MYLNPGRLNNPTSIASIEISGKLTERGKLTIQFDNPDAYPISLLQILNDICRQSTDQLEVRFYGHYKTGFDAAILRELPDVKNLSLDCLLTIRNEDMISNLGNLSKLHFGVFEIDRPEFLNSLDLSALTSIILGENRKRNLNLSPLATCASLEQLTIGGFSDEIDAVAGLPNLKEITLRSFAKRHRIAFLKGVPNLQHLTLILGGRVSIEEFSSESLKELQLIRVQGLTSLGDLSRFSNLRWLWVEDQLKVNSLDLSGTQLEHLTLYNCKSLANLSSLESQTRLREFQSSRVLLNSDALRDFRWPISAQTVRIFSGTRKWNETAAASLKARGFGQDAIWSR